MSRPKAGKGMNTKEIQVTLKSRGIMVDDGESRGAKESLRATENPKKHLG